MLRSFKQSPEASLLSELKPESFRFKWVEHGVKHKAFSFTSVSLQLWPLTSSPGRSQLHTWIWAALLLDSGARGWLWVPLFSRPAACHLLVSLFKAGQEFGYFQREEERKNPSASGTRGGKMRERRIKTTWDGEIEFKSAANKCTQLTFARRKRRETNSRQGTKTNLLSGIRATSWAFQPLPFSPKTKTQKRRSSVLDAGSLSLKTRLSCDR